MLRVSLCQRNKSKNIFTWYARIFDTETKDIRYESLGTTKKTEAHDLMLAKQAAGDFSRDARSSMKLEKAFELYLSDVESRGSSAATVAQLRRCLHKMDGLMETPIAAITKADVLETFNRNASGMKPVSYNNAKTVIRTAFRFARDVLDVIQTNPADSLKSRKNTSKERDFWTVDEVVRIIEATDDRSVRLAFAFMAYAGLRVHEAIKVKPSDIRDGFLSVVGKGRKFAKVPVSSRMRDEIGLAGINFDLSHLTPHVITGALQRIAKRAIPEGFKGSSNPHRFRHSFASALLKSGISPRSLQKLLRHSNITTTLQIYSHLMDEDLSNDIEKMFTGH